MRSHAQTAAWLHAAAHADDLAAIAEDTPTDDDLADVHELEGLALAAGLEVAPSLLGDPRLTAWDRAALAALSERRMVASEVAARLRPGLVSEGPEVERLVSSLVARRRCARVAGGGFIVLRRVP